MKFPLKMRAQSRSRENNSKSILIRPQSHRQTLFQETNNQAIWQRRPINIYVTWNHQIAYLIATWVSERLWLSAKGNKLFWIFGTKTTA
jgi:hypothetical protein